MVMAEAWRAANLDGAQARRNEGEEGSVTQPYGLAGIHPSEIDAGKELVSVLGIEAHQNGSGPAGAGLDGFWSDRFGILGIPFRRADCSQERKIAKRQRSLVLV